MYTITKSVIHSQCYELSAMCRKIDTLWLRDQITDAQRDELLALAREKADPRMSVDLFSRYAELEGRVSALERSMVPGTPAFPEYEAGHAYRRGDGITFQGAQHRCIAPEGFLCVWSPADYPAYWEKV